MWLQGCLSPGISSAAMCDPEVLSPVIIINARPLHGSSGTLSFAEPLCARDVCLDQRCAARELNGLLQVYVASAEAASCRRILVDALGLDDRSSMGHCMQQVVLRIRMQSQEGGQIPFL